MELQPASALEMKRWKAFWDISEKASSPSSAVTNVHTVGILTWLSVLVPQTANQLSATTAFKD